MSDLLWPGDERAGDVLSDAALLRAFVSVESAWLEALVGAGIAPSDAADQLEGLVGPADLGALASAAEEGGNPVIPLVELLRERVGSRNPEAARWLHRGLTSQDVVDTGLVLAARDAVTEISTDLRRQVTGLVEIVEQHRTTRMVARTLTQHAVPTTFGLTAAGWLTGVLDAYDELGALALPVQVGGAAGTMAATVELAAGDADPAGAVTSVTRHVADRLGLVGSPPWHGTRTTVTRLGDAAVRCTDGWGRIARDVLLLTRPEIGEVGLARAGGSSTMPHKQNPTLAVLVRRAALAAPPLASTLHLAAADQVDQRADGAWHTEWAAVRTLLRRTVVAGRQTADLLDALEPDPDRMRQNLEAAGSAVLAEQHTMADLTGAAPAGDYLGATDAFVEAHLARAAEVLERSKP